MRITKIHIFLDVGHWTTIDRDMEIVRETEKCYFAVDKNGKEWRYLKDEIGIPIVRYPSYKPYLEYILIDGTKQQLRDGLAKWFSDNAKSIKKGEIETDYNEKE